MNSNDLAQLSNNAVAGAIAVYTLALIAYAVGAATRRSAARRPAAHHADSVPLSTAAATGAHPASSYPSTTVAATEAVEPGKVGAAYPLRFVDRLADVLVGLGTVLLAAGVLARGLAVERVPWGTMYEFTLAAALAAALALSIGLRHEPIRTVAAWVVGLVALALGLAVTVLYAPAGGLVPVLESYWLVVHVAAAIVAGGIFTLGFVLVLAFLVRTRAERRRLPGATTGLSAERMDRMAYTLHLIAFPIWTFAVIAGAIWAENAWGRYWGWDPKETWAFITWVFYAAYLHAQATPRWRGGRAAVIAVLGYLAFLFNFFGVNLWISGLHSYAGV